MSGTPLQKFVQEIDWYEYYELIYEFNKMKDRSGVKKVVLHINGFEYDRIPHKAMNCTVEIYEE